MTTVQNTLLNEISEPLPGVRVEVYLLAPGTGDVAFNEDSAQIVSRVVTSTDANGVWTLDLIPNAEISPANTAYRVVHWVIGTENPTSVFTVPVDGATHGIHDLEDLLVAGPSALALTGVVLVSPNGTLYRIIVSNGGSLSTVVV